MFIRLCLHTLSPVLTHYSMINYEPNIQKHSLHNIHKIILVVHNMYCQTSLCPTLTALRYLGKSASIHLCEGKQQMHYLSHLYSNNINSVCKFESGTTLLPTRGTRKYYVKKNGYFIRWHICESIRNTSFCAFDDKKFHSTWPLFCLVSLVMKWLIRVTLCWHNLDTSWHSLRKSIDARPGFCFMSSSIRCWKHFTWYLTRVDSDYNTPVVNITSLYFAPLHTSLWFAMPISLVTYQHIIIIILDNGVLITYQGVQSSE